MERDFFPVLDQTTDNTLKLQLHLDDAHPAVLKEERLYTHY